MSNLHPHWTWMPNFVDTGVFRPAADGVERAACRKRFGVPGDAFVVGCVAAVKCYHKRIDYLVEEFARYAGSDDADAGAFLAIVGASTPDTAALRALAAERMPGRHAILTDLGREDMPAFYRALDVFVLPSLFEMMPVAVLEALASGLPVVLNRHPVLEWMAGEGGGEEEQQAESEKLETRNSKLETIPSGWCIDMSREGELAALLGALTAEALAPRGRAARERAVKEFSTEAVIDRYVAYYRSVLT